MSGLVDSSCHNEVVMLKMHGSIDWFDRKHYRIRQEMARDNGHPHYVPDDPIFNSPKNLRTIPLVSGARFSDDPLREVHRVLDIERLYADPPFLLSTPTLITPSTQKVVYAQQLRNYWNGKGRDGGHSFRMVIIGYSLPPHDNYARQVIYHLVTRYQDIPAEQVDSRRRKEPLIVVDFCDTEGKKTAFRERYKFVDWDRTHQFLDGFTDNVIEFL